MAANDATALNLRSDDGSGDPRRRPALAVALAAVLALLVTVLVAAVEGLAFAWHNEAGHVAMETAATLIASLAALLALMRARRTRALTDALLIAALTLLALTNFAFSLVPALLDEGSARFATWAPVAGRTLGALAFLGAAFAPARPVVDAVRATRWALAASCGAVAAIALVLWAVGDALPRGVDVRASADASGRPDLSSPNGVLVIQLVTMVAYAGAALGFLRRARQSPGGRTTWLAVGTTLAAFSRLNYSLYPSLYSEYLYIGDLLRLAFYLAILAAVASDIVGYERRLRASAVLAERRRMARDLHDGLAQELSYITGQGRLLEHRFGHDDTTAAIVRSAERALLQSRQAIAALTSPPDEPFAERLRRSAEVGARGKALVEVVATDGVDPAEPRAEALLRIAAEATANAVRHGDAQTIRISVENGPRGLRMEVRDDGRGFDPGAVRPGAASGFGLVSMRERAEDLGGAFTVASNRGEGTRIDVRLP